MTRTAIIAGRGTLPKILFDALENAFVVGVQDFCDPKEWTDDYAIYPIAKIGKIIECLKNNNVKNIVLAGGIDRPALSKLVPDTVGAKLITKLALKGRGDDSALRIVKEFLESYGFCVLGIEDVLGSQNLDVGCLTIKQPNDIAIKDIQRGRDVLEIMSNADVGQGLCVQEGLVLSVEAIEGTDNMIKRTKNLIRNGNKPVLVKMIKPQQSRKLDLPTIGVDTIINLHQNGFSGCAISANGIVLIDKDSIIKSANELGLFITVI